MDVAVRSVEKALGEELFISIMFSASHVFGIYYGGIKCCAVRVHDRQMG